MRRVALVMLLLLVACTQRAFLENGVTAHRGDSWNHPENTMAAFESALSLGADWLECDVFTTQDGVLVVAHDASTARTGDRALTIGDTPWDDLRSVDVAAGFRKKTGRDVTAMPMPTLRELLARVMRQQRTRLSIQPKDHSTAAAVALVRELGADRWVGFNDGSLTKMKLVKQLAPQLRVFWDRPAEGDVDADLAIAEAHGFEALVYHFSGVDAVKVQRVHEAGLEIGAWTVNDEAGLRRLIALGVDRIYTDRPAFLLRLWDRVKASTERAGMRRGSSLPRR